MDSVINSIETCYHITPVSRAKLKPKSNVDNQIASKDDENMNNDVDVHDINDMMRKGNA